MSGVTLDWLPPNNIQINFGVSNNPIVIPPATTNEVYCTIQYSSIELPFFATFDDANMEISIAQQCDRDSVEIGGYGYTVTLQAEIADHGLIAPVSFIITMNDKTCA